MKNKTTKILSCFLILSMLCGLGACSSTGTGTAAGVSAAAHAAGSSSSAHVLAASVGTDAVNKDETVYVFTGTDGSAKKIVVSDCLSNIGGTSAVKDRSTLTGITNVKGDETFTDNGSGSIVWNAAGKDICYQGTAAAELPVGVKVSYKLDGKDISADNLAGRNGRVTIHFDYTNSMSRTVKAGNKNTTVYMPFIMITGVLLDNSRFSNIKVTNGKFVNDGDRTAVVGCALPGLQESLGVGKDKVDIPDSFEISADATKFSLDTAITVATNADLSDLNLSGVNSPDQLKDSLSNLQNASKQLVSGSRQLADSMDTLLEKSGPLFTGIGSLSGGLGTLSSNSASIDAGAAQVFNTLLATANSQISAAGLDVPALTIDNYSTVLGGVLSQISGGNAQKYAYNIAYSKVSAAVREQESAIKAQVTAAVQKTVYEEVLKAAGMDMTYDQYQQALTAGLVPSDKQAAVEAAVAKQMAEDTVQAKISAATEGKIKELIDQNMSTADVQAQIKAGAASASAGADSLSSLKQQLDSYNTFYTGLKKYTGGVDSAASAAKTVASGAESFKSGAEAIRDGADKLADGMSDFDKEGIQKLVDAFDGDLNGLVDRLQAISDFSKGYTSYSGIADGMSGSVKFVFKADAVGEQ